MLQSFSDVSSNRSRRTVSARMSISYDLPGGSQNPSPTTRAHPKPPQPPAFRSRAPAVRTRPAAGQGERLLGHGRRTADLHRRAFPAPHRRSTTSGSSTVSSASKSPRRAAAMNASTISRWRVRSASVTVPAPCTRRRARLASCRAAVWTARRWERSPRRARRTCRAARTRAARPDPASRGRRATRGRPNPPGSPRVRGRSFLPHGSRWDRARKRPAALRAATSASAGCPGTRGHHRRRQPRRFSTALVSVLLSHSQPSCTASFLGERAQHPVDHRPHLAPVLFEPLRQPGAVAHDRIPTSWFVRVRLGVRSAQDVAARAVKTTGAARAPRTVTDSEVRGGRAGVVEDHDHVLRVPRRMVAAQYAMLRLRHGAAADGGSRSRTVAPLRSPPPNDSDEWQPSDVTRTYVLTILGVWRLLGAITLFAPGLPRLKEWALCRHLLPADGRGRITPRARRCARRVVGSDPHGFAHPVRRLSCRHLHLWIPQYLLPRSPAISCAGPRSGTGLRAPCASCPTSRTTCGGTGSERRAPWSRCRSASSSSARSRPWSPPSAGT